MSFPAHPIVRKSPGILATIILFFIATAAAYDGFYDKWQFRDDGGLSLVSYFEGTTGRPFAYRRLVPDVVATLEQFVPAFVERALLLPDGTPKSRLASPQARDPRYRVRYHMVYYLCFASLFVAAFLMCRICLQQGVSATNALFAPVVFLLSFPLMLTVGGYFYDITEVMFLAAAVTSALAGRGWLLLPIAALGAWNKESFLFFLPTLYPLLVSRSNRANAAGWIAAAMVCAGMVYLYQRHLWAGNEGSTVQTHLMAQLQFFLNPANLLAREINYGITGPRAYNIVVLIAVGWIVWRGWSRLAPAVRQHVVLCVLINVPLFILFCAPGEIRNLSFLYMGFLMLTAAALDRVRGELVASAAGGNEARES